MLSFVLRSCRLVCLFCLFSPLPINGETLASKPEGKNGSQGLFVHQYFIAGWHFSTIFPTLFSFHRADLRLEGERERLSHDEAVSKVSFGGWLVDKWGKIEPEQMGEDNGRVRGKIDHLDLEQQWDCFPPRWSFEGFDSFICANIKDNLSGYIMRSTLGRRTLPLFVIR